MKTLFLIFSLGCITVMVHAQINKMYRPSNITQARQYDNEKRVSQNSVVSNPASSYHGMINISPDLNSKLEAEWNVPAKLFGGNQLKVELWSVVYQPYPNQQNSTQIILQQRIVTHNLSYQAVAGGISFSATSLPPDNNLVVIVYCNQLKTAPGLVIKGKPDDDRQDPFRHYQSDVQYKLGQNIIYGIYSIVPGKTDLSHLDFSFFMPVDNQTTSLIDSSHKIDSLYNAGNIKQPEYRKMQNLRLINVGPAQSTAALDLVCYNPNNYELQVAGASGNIYIDSSVVLGQFQLSKQVQVEKNSEFILPALIKINTVEVLKNQDALFKNEEALLKIKGTATVNIAGFSKQVLIEYEDTQNIEKFKVIVPN